MAQETLGDMPLQKEKKEEVENDAPHSNFQPDPEQDLEKGEPLPTQQEVPYSVFSKGQKVYIVFLISLAGFFSPTSSSIYFPALSSLATDLHQSSSAINVSITTYMILQGIAPILFSSMSNVVGRRPPYMLAFIIYMAANIGLALQTNYVALLVLRMMQSAGSSGTISLAFGVMADISTRAERGTYVGWVASGALLGPGLGPVIGGILVEFLGWRSVFWFLTIFGGVVLLVMALTLPETSRPIVGNGSIKPPPRNMCLIDLISARRTARSRNPGCSNAQTQRPEKGKWPNIFKLLGILLEKDVAILATQNGLILILTYGTIATLPLLFQQTYGLNDLEVGLCYLPYGSGCVLASFAIGRILDLNYRRIAKQFGLPADRKVEDDSVEFPIERARVEVTCIPMLVGAFTTIGYGWSMSENGPLAVALILTFILGFCLTGSANVMSTLLVDMYPNESATATAVINMVRCFAGAVVTGVIVPMLRAMGRGGTFTFLAGLTLLGSPSLLVLIARGPRWRSQRRERQAPQ